MAPPLKARFARFNEAIRPTPAQRKQASKELQFLEDKLSDFIKDDDPFEFVKALRSGGFAKATSLRRAESADFDADLAVYVIAADGAATPTGDLLDYLEKLARRAYKDRTTRKPKFDREPESSVRIIFDVTPKLNIDLVPVVALDHASIPNWGVIPRRDGEKRHTSVTEHIEFVRSREKDSAAVPFHDLLRLFKRWRNYAFDEIKHSKVSSFFLELVFGKAYDEQEHGLAGEALDDLLSLARWVSQHGLDKEISFTDSRVPVATQTHIGPVIVLDPMNRDNNIAHDWTHQDRDDFLQKIDELVDILRDAEIEAEEDEEDEAIDFVEQVFPDFREMSEE